MTMNRRIAQMENQPHVKQKAYEHWLRGCDDAGAMAFTVILANWDVLIEPGKTARECAENYWKGTTPDAPEEHPKEAFFFLSYLWAVYCSTPAQFYREGGESIMLDDTRARLEVFFDVETITLKTGRALAASYDELNEKYSVEETIEIIERVLIRAGAKVNYDAN